MSMRRWRWAFIAPAAIVGLIVFVAIGGEVVRQLWNWLMPPIFGWEEISFWQALGLLVLCRILFGGHNVGGRSRWNHRSREEREQFRQRMRERFGQCSSHSEGGARGTPPPGGQSML